MNDDTRNVYMICIDGGPNGGKSTGKSAIAKYLTSMGYAVVTTPEAATDLMMQGVHPSMCDDALIFQDLVFNRTVDNEKFFMLAVQMMENKSLRKKSVMICDRGLMSGKAYTSHGDFTRLLGMHGFTENSARNARYDLVIHMCSTACGVEDVYEATRKNNPVRVENVQEARLLDAKTIQAWIGHRDLEIITNEYDSFEEKINAVIGVIAKRLGLPMPIGEERKYLVADIAFSFPENTVHAVIRQYYLGEKKYIREMRFACGTVMYFFVEKDATPSSRRLRLEKVISRAEFDHLAQSPDVRCTEIKKTRHFFVWDNQYFRLDVFSAPHRLLLLEAQTTTTQRAINLPPFLTVVRDVTDDARYYNYAIAHAEN